MKTKLITLCLILTMGTAFVACTPENQLDQNEYQTDKNKNCPPNDTNCNGIPDNQE